MLDSLRRGAQTWVAKILFALLIASFGVWGISGSLQGYGQGSLAKVGDIEISTVEFQQAYQTQFDNLRRRFGGRITPEQARAFGFDQQVLSQLVGAAAIDNHTRALQLGLSDGAVTERLKRDPRFAGGDGKFNKPAFDGFLRQNGITERTFLNLSRRDEVRDQMTVALVDAVAVPTTMIDVLHKYREETRRIAHFVLDPTKVPSVGEPDEKKLELAYEQNKQRFMTPELRAAAVLMLTAEALKKTVVVSDDEVKAAYEQNPERFAVVERRRIQQIAFGEKAKADAAALAITAGKSFADVAKESGAKDTDIDLGLVSKKELIDQKVAEAAFKLAKDKVSSVVEGRFNNVLLRVTEIQAGKQKSLAEATAEMKEILLAERANSEVQKLHDQVEEGRSSGRALKELAATTKLPLIEIAGSDRTGKSVDGKMLFENAELDKIMTAVFANKVGSEVEPVELVDGGFAWVEVQGTVEKKQRELADAKAEVKALWIETETRRAITAATSKFAERISKGDAIDVVAKEAGGTVVISDPSLRAAKPVGLTEQAMNQAFALASGAAASTESIDGKSRIVFKVVEIIAAAAITPEQTDKIKAELQRQMQSDVMAGYLAGLQERFEVKVNANAFQRAIGADRDQQQQ